MAHNNSVNHTNNVHCKDQLEQCQTLRHNELMQPMGCRGKGLYMTLSDLVGLSKFTSAVHSMLDCANVPLFKNRPYINIKR